MTSGFRNSAGVDFDDLFDPDTQGNGPTMSTLVRADGTPLRYAHIQYGSKRADVGWRNTDGTDVSNYWSQKGSAVYTMGFNGRNYSVTNNLRGGATIKLYMLNDGTWQIHKFNPSEQMYGGGAGIDSGTWLPPGDSVANWTCSIGISQNGSTVGNASHSASSTANTQQPLTSQQSAQATSQANIVGSQDVSSGQIQLVLYRLGVQRSVSTLNYQTSAYGN